MAVNSPLISVASEEELFFEGAEKLLEIWFEMDKRKAQVKSLREIPVVKWIDLLNLAHCQIISKCSNEKMDAYVLSESSMFVSDVRFILKTCGSTRLLDTVESLIALVHEVCRMDKVLNVYYSRKNFAKPEKQNQVHRNFELEFSCLDRFFDNGAAYCLGSLKQDRWYLYTLNPSLAPLSRVDHTLEILMTELPLEIMSIFTKERCSNGRQCTLLAGIDKLLPVDTQIDDVLFHPCGYSMNGIVANSDQYATIHVTPESMFSYVSFETNQVECDLYKLANKVLACFKPNKFLLTIFANDLSINGREGQQKLWQVDINGYKRTDLQLLRLEYDTLIYAQYRKQ